MQNAVSRRTISRRLGGFFSTLFGVCLCVHCVLCANPTNFLLVLREAELVDRVDQCLKTELLKVLSVARIKRIHGVALQSDGEQCVEGLSGVEPG
jgi:hypothetical protein